MQVILLSNLYVVALPFSPTVPFDLVWLWSAASVVPIVSGQFNWTPWLILLTVAPLSLPTEADQAELKLLQQQIKGRWCGMPDNHTVFVLPDPTSWGRKCLEHN